jgi:hypothetical protein
MLVQVDAQDDYYDFPNSLLDVDITASAGEFLEFDPTGGVPPWGCTDQGFSPDSFRCRVNSNGFAQSNTFAPQAGGANTSTFNDTLSILNSFATGTTHIQVCNYHYSSVLSPYYYMASAFAPDAADCDNNTSHIEAWWQAPPGFLGGTVTFCAMQNTTVCTNKTIVGPVASLELHAFRNASSEASQCKGTDVHVIASADYSFNNVTTFDNNRAILCVEARDSNGTLVNNQVITWTTTKGVVANVTNTGGPPANVNNANNTLTSGGSAASGDVAHVVAQIGSASASVDVAFGGDPKSCSIPVIGDLDIGDSAHVVATFVDSKGNPVPDGIVAHLEEVDSGDGADNVQFVSVAEDTVNGVVEGDIIGAISGDTTIAASVEQIAGADPTCTETVHLTGDIHVTPGVCDDTDFILYGNKPPAGGGFGTFAFCGGDYDQLLKASGCPKATSAFFYNKTDGGFAVWIPGTEVSSVNDEIFSIFPNVHTPIPTGTIFTAKCK